MLIPRFSIRSLLLVMTGAALFFFAASQAVRGKGWAVAVVAVGVTVALLAVIHAATFVVLWMVAWITGRDGGGASTTPFAQQTPRSTGNRDR